jgi:pimeloyl-ACP methyl ester carboxylesterase
MRISVIAGGLLLLGLACAPEVKSVPPPAVVLARFDPGRTPPVVPTPNDLATDPKTGLLNITPAPDASEADQTLIAYLNTLDGFPGSSTAAATFSSGLSPDSVMASTVRVLDLTTGHTPVEGASITYVDQPEDPEARGRLNIKGPGGVWEPGHTYAVALIGGEGGLRGTEGQPVVGSSAWLLLRSANSLTTCEDLSSPDCHSTTDLLPSQEEDPAARRADQARTAVLLEGLRRKYKPAVDHLISQGVKREDIALLWSFQIATRPQVVFNPAVTPPRVPVPTDLAIDPVTGRVNAPINPSASLAEQEFTRDYLNTLTGFPSSTTAAVEISGGDLDPATVTPATVRFLTLRGAPEGTPSPALAYDAARKRITLTPPAGGWPRGSTFAVAVLAGPDLGVRMTDGRIPVGSEVWALLRGRARLTTCEDLTAADCASAVRLVQVAPADAIRLETIRRQYAPVLDQLEAEGIAREHIAILWTFSIVPNAEATFDPANRVVPFPTDLARIPGTATTPARVNLPIPDGSSPEAAALITQLNTLDGFSTTAPIVSENGEAQGVLDVGTLPASSLGAGVGFFKLTPGGNEPRVRVCLNCASRPLPDISTPTAPQQLQFIPEVPLDEQSTYGGYLTTELVDSRGLSVIASPAFALMRSSAPLLDEQGHSLVSLITDEQARQLEPARLTLKPMMDALAAWNIPRPQVALAWSFTTQSTRPTLPALAALPAQMGLTTAVTNLSTTLTTFVKNNSNNPYPYDRLGNVYLGRLSLPDALTGPGGRLDLEHARPTEVPFLLTTPSSSAPASGYPVVIWGHPLTGSRLTALAIANAFAASGVAMLAVDLPRHGDRASCVGSKDSLALGGATSDDAACEDASTQRCSEVTGRCVSRPGSARTTCRVPVGQPDDALCFIAGEGLCLSDGFCEGGTFKEDPSTGLPLISGWDFIGSDFFVNRDHFMQPVAELAQLVRIIEAQDAGSLNAQLGTRRLDSGRIHYAGMSLGGMTGALAASATPGVHRVVLNAAGADFPSILLDGLTPEARASFLARVAAAGLTPGTPAFDQFIGILQWVLEPGDAASQAPALLSGPGAPADRQVLVQYVEGDPIIPNANTLRLVSSANRAPTAPSAAVRQHTAPASVSGRDRHGFLLTGANRNVTDTAHQQLTQNAQQQAVRFITTGSPE